ncbi:MAG: HAD-superfamily hydrolase, subfamily IA, variant 3 [Parcubacteria group bacterium GW2011_GWC2_39_14]|nr:MAG: HAD-superfamily hydrolase, subfamily IA, variant 3 [Parcubacteria group bacterium GW2011_GWC2_39_14]KKR55062.1 MAG: HAD-superfamily hydrolase, subfamily IA, variant 3 [Parcubacteria group bacterium GW2011_GWA2_40_23]
MIKAIIFDLNGVFIQSRMLSDRFAEDFKIPSDKFLPALKGIMAQVRLPNANDLYSYWQPYFFDWKINLSKQEFYDYWFKTETDIPEMLELAENMKKQGLKIFILSNNLRERTHFYEETFSFLKTLPEKGYYSWQTGFVKPDERAYKLILEENDLKPEECLYFDDSEKNVEVANSLGIKSYKFENLEKLKEQLRQNNL